MELFAKLCIRWWIRCLPASFYCSRIERPPIHRFDFHAGEPFGRKPLSERWAFHKFHALRKPQYPIIFQGGVTTFRGPQSPENHRCRKRKWKTVLRLFSRMRMSEVKPDCLFERGSLHPLDRLR